MNPRPFLVGSEPELLGLVYDLNSISCNEQLLVGGDYPNLNLGVVSRDLLLAAYLVLLFVELDTQVFHVLANFLTQVAVVLADTAGESDCINAAHSSSIAADELLDLVDNKKLQFTVAVDISYIDKEVQGWIYEYISDTGFIKPKQIAALRNQLNDGPINQIQMLSIFNNCVMAKKVSRSLTFSEKKLTKYFPDDYTAKDMEQVIESLLEKWMQEQSC